MTYCQVIDNNRKHCSQEYKNLGGFTGNLIAHLHDAHSIIDQDADKQSKAKKARKIKLIFNLIVTEPEYKEKMAEFDPSFNIPGEHKICTLIAKSYQYNQNNLQNLLTNTVDYISLTMDLWSSRAKHGYLGITANWITSDFKFKDIMIDIIYLPSPHTAKAIADTLYNAINKWNLQHHVNSNMTNNGSNVISALSILNTMQGYSTIKRLPCAAHTLQLVVKKDEKNGVKLKKIMLSNEEWDLINNLIDLLMLFEEITCELSGGSYVTLNNNEELYLIEPEEDIITSNFTQKKINIKDPLNTDSALNNIKKKYYALLYYWNIPDNLDYMASLLDPRYKDLDFIENEEEKNDLFQQLCNEYKALNNSESNFKFQEDVDTTSLNQKTLNTARSHKEYIQHHKNKGKKQKHLDTNNENNEVLHYLSLPKASENENPLEW
ncbi:zinc finger bed domain-containing protein 1-like [Gigaspora margarita]|uniref:Zinc finger bed domain-containing protein 1-like n=1 Tax=Gigaspora margarita TaxID=4874 RepID=A0A8H4AUD3_GIGMA|nr:zinc finger bed domain-containing protein 1-like [Gigaspora margarita]